MVCHCVWESFRGLVVMSCDSQIDQRAPPMRLDCKSLLEEYQITNTNKFEALLQCDEEKTPEELWKIGKEIITNADKESISMNKKKKEWISDQTLNEVTVRKEIKSRGA